MKINNFEKIHKRYCLADIKASVKSVYPNAICYNKNGYFYVVPEKESGNTLGSANSIHHAWLAAYEYLEEEGLLK